MEINTRFAYSVHNILNQEQMELADIEYKKMTGTPPVYDKSDPYDVADEEHFALIVTTLSLQQLSLIKKTLKRFK